MLNRIFFLALSLMVLLANSGPVLADDDDDVSKFAGSFLAQAVGGGPPALLFTYTSDGTAVVHGVQNGNGWWTQTGPLEISGVIINHAPPPVGSLLRAEFVQVYTVDLRQWTAEVCFTFFPAGTGPSNEPVFGPLPPLGPPTFESCDFEVTLIADRIGLPVDDDGDDDDDDDDD